MDEQQTATPGGEPPAATIPSTATMAEATAQATVRSGGKKVTPNRLIEQASALQAAETIKQLQHQVRQLEAQSKDTGKVFLATTTSLITSAFALVAALAWNEAIQDLFKFLYPPPSGGEGERVAGQLVVSSFIYAVIVTIIVVAIIFYLTRLNTRLGVKSLIGGGSGGEIKKE